MLFKLVLRLSSNKYIFVVFITLAYKTSHQINSSFFSVLKENIFWMLHTLLSG